MNYMKQKSVIWKIAVTYMGAIIGAGFASGQELLRFFVVFGQGGAYGVILSGVLFALLGWLIIIFCEKKNISSYEELTIYLFGKRIGQILEIAITLMLWVGLVVMFAGSGAIFAEHLGQPTTYGISLTLIIVLIALFFKGSGVTAINSILIPGLTILAVYVSVTALLGINQIMPAYEKPESLLANTHWTVASMVYVAYNMVLGIVILASLDREGQGRYAGIGAILGGLFLGLIGLIKVMALLDYGERIFEYQIPMLHLAEQQLSWIKLPFTFALWSAMVTTAVANGYGLAKRLQNLPLLSYHRAVFLVTLIGLPLTKLKFSSLVGTLYPVLGYIGLIIVGMIIYKIIRHILWQR